jgi:hypothetical protein
MVQEHRPNQQLGLTQVISITTTTTMIEPTVDFVYPEDELDKEENCYREASKRGLRVINNIIDYIEEADDKDVALWVVCYAIGSFKCQGVSMSDKAAQLGMSVQAFQKRIKILERQVNINNTQYTYEK